MGMFQFLTLWTLPGFRSMASGTEWMLALLCPEVASLAWDHAEVSHQQRCAGKDKNENKSLTLLPVMLDNKEASPVLGVAGERFTVVFMERLWKAY